MASIICIALFILVEKNFQEYWYGKWTEVALVLQNILEYHATHCMYSYNLISRKGYHSYYDLSLEIVGEVSVKQVF